MNDKVKAFWNDQAETYGSSDLATAPDHYYRQHEINCILPLLKDGESMLDVGCGNGYATLQFANVCPNSPIIGVDYSEPMIKAAIAARGGRPKPPLFIVGNVLALDQSPLPVVAPYDTIICTRVLINLKDWNEQREAILQMKDLLRPGGRLILVENTQEGLARLNELRQQFGLFAIKERWHNYYAPQGLLEDFLLKHFSFMSAENIGSLYYIISRVVYAKLAQLEGQEPQYDHPINRIASQLPLLGDYSPNMLYVLTV